MVKFTALIYASGLARSFCDFILSESRCTKFYLSISDIFSDILGIASKDLDFWAMRLLAQVFCVSTVWIWYTHFHAFDYDENACP